MWLQAFDSTVNLRACEGHPSQNLGLCSAGWVDPLALCHSLQNLGDMLDMAQGRVEGFVWIPDLPLPTSLALNMALPLLRLQSVIYEMV